MSRFGQPSLASSQRLSHIAPTWRRCISEASRQLFLRMRFMTTASVRLYYLPGAAGWGSALAGYTPVRWDPLIQTGGRQVWRAEQSIWVRHQGHGRHPDRGGSD